MHQTHLPTSRPAYTRRPFLSVRSSEAIRLLFPTVCLSGQSQLSSWSRFCLWCAWGLLQLFVPDHCLHFPTPRCRFQSRRQRGLVSISPAQKGEDSSNRDFLGIPQNPRVCACALSAHCQLSSGQARSRMSCCNLSDPTSCLPIFTPHRTPPEALRCFIWTALPMHKASMAPMAMSSSSVSLVRFRMVKIPTSLSSLYILRCKRTSVGPAHALDLIEHIY